MTAVYLPITKEHNPFSHFCKANFLIMITHFQVSQAKLNLSFQNPLPVYLTQRPIKIYSIFQQFFTSIQCVFCLLLYYINITTVYSCMYYWWSSMCVGMCKLSSMLLLCYSNCLFKYNFLLIAYFV